MTNDNKIYHPALEPMLTQLRDSFLDDETGEYVFDTAEFLKDRKKFLLDNKLGGLPLEYVSGIYVCPIFSEQLCDALLKLADAQAPTFTPNPEEPVQAQIPEIVFEERFPELYEQFLVSAAEAVIPLFLFVNGTTATQVNSVQMARYTPENTAHGCWHTDEDSMYTCVVSLGPERHEGGGTSFLPEGPLGRVVELPPLPKGWAAFFNGKVVQHMGMPVTKGVRDLLVFWME